MGGPHILLAAAPTAPPCFRRWLSSCVCCFFEPSLQGLEKAEHCPSFASLHLPLAAVSSATVVAVALAELGSIAGAAPPPTRCLSNYSKCASGSPLRGNRRICAVVLPSPLGNSCQTKTALPKQSRKSRNTVKSALAELGSTTCSLQTVFHETEAQFCLILRGFSSILLFVHQFLNPRFCRLLSDFNPNLFLMCRLLC